MLVNNTRFDKGKFRAIFMGIRLRAVVVNRIAPTCVVMSVEARPGKVVSLIVDDTFWSFDFNRRLIVHSGTESTLTPIDTDRLSELKADFGVYVT